MIFQRSLKAEFASVGLGVFVILLVIVLTTMLVRLLGQAAGGSVAPEGVVALLGFTVLNYLPALLTLTLFVAILLTLTRCYRDSEMIVWLCSGLGLTSWIRPVLSFALPMVVTIALLSLFLSPWALSKSDEYVRLLESRDDVSIVSPGIFRESKHADRVFFVEKIEGQQNRVANVFVQSMQHGKIGIMVAAEGLQETVENGDRFLVLLNGARYEGAAGSAEYKVTYFERYAMRIEAHEVRQSAAPVKTLPTFELLQDPNPDKIAQLEWRIGLPIIALILSLFAIPLSFVNPRAGRSLNLVMAVLVYVIYNNSHSVVNVWVAQSKIEPWLGLWVVHAGMLVILAIMFLRRMTMFSSARFRQ